MKNQNKKSRQSSNSLKELLRLGPLRREIEAPQGFRCFFPIRLDLRAHPSRPLEQLLKNEVADHVMDDACDFATIYLWQMLGVYEAGGDMALEGVRTGSGWGRRG